jgi:HlyD family secretion protein
MKRNTWIALTTGVVVVGGAAFFLFRKPSDEVKWRTGKVSMGSITQKISATGSLNALVQVPVGTQVSGVVTGLYADFNSIVKKGQVIARIDPTVWETQLRDAEAGLQRAKDAYANAKVDYARNKRLFEQNLIASADLDIKDLALKTAAGNLESAKASLERAKINLSYCTITAPVDGVVVSRVVDEGQTVAASFSTPNLFTIAQDLAKLKVDAAIDEADIGQVQVGQKAFFTVDSYPDRQFQGQVSQVQLNPVVNNNVVTYTVEMEVSNELRDLSAASRDASPRKGWQKDAQGAPGHSRKTEGGGADAASGAHRNGPWGQKGAAGGTRADAANADKIHARINSQVATIETTTARYIKPGSPIYKGDLALFPGMTANVTIVTNQRSDVLRVPNAALRFNPAAFQKDDKKTGNSATSGTRLGGNATGGNKGGILVKREDRVWTLENGKTKPLPVKIGITDGQFTEVLGEGIQEGVVILVGVEDTKKADTTAAKPVLGAPGPPGGGRR